MDFIKQYGNHMTHAVTITMLAAVLGLDVTGTTNAQHTHPEFDLVEQNSDKISRILEISIVERLEVLHKARCMGDQGRTQFIIELEADYRELTGVQYPVRTCEYYLSIP